MERKERHNGETGYIENKAKGKLCPQGGKFFLRKNKFKEQYHQQIKRR